MMRQSDHRVTLKYFDLPDASMLREGGREYFYSETLTVLINRKDVVNWELIAGLFCSVPTWFDYLAKWRDCFAAAFGLKTSLRDPTQARPPYLVGQRLGFFCVQKVSDREVVLGDDDVHLDFRTSLMMTPHPKGTLLSVSTVVDTKNLLGRVYFTCVRPIHRLLVPLVVKRMARVIEQRALPTYFYEIP